MGGVLAHLRTWDRMTRERLRLWALAVLAASLGGLLFLLATSDGLNDYQGRPLGTDFSNVYAAGTYVLDGQPGTAFGPTLAACPRADDLRQGSHAVLRLALSAVLPVRRSVAGGDAVRLGARGLARRDPAGFISEWAVRDPARRAGAARSGARSAVAPCSPSPSPPNWPTSATATTAFSPPRCWAAHCWSSTAGRLSPASCSGCSPTSRSSAS